MKRDRYPAIQPPRAILPLLIFLLPVLSPGSEPAEQTSGMVASAHPLATEVGVQILRTGGNAMDAAIATAFALNVVEPDAGGIGGGGFLVFFDATTRSVGTIDCRERAPARLMPETYCENGKPRQDALKYGGPSIGVPGTLKGLVTAHALHGRLPLESLIRPAIDLADRGFPITEKMSALIENKAGLLGSNVTASAIFLVDGKPPPPGFRLVQPDLADTFRAIVHDGAAAIYGHGGAERIASAAQEAGGVLSFRDLVQYEPVTRDPVSGRYREFDLFAMGPPSRGGIVVLQALRILESYAMSELAPGHPRFLALLIGALYETYQSGDRHVADPATTEIDVEFLLSDDWANDARTRIGIPTVLPVPDARSTSAHAHAGAAGPSSVVDDSGNTTHLSIIDGEGNAVAFTFTINYHFGSGIVVPGMGILLNNELDDFSLAPGHINAPAPGKIPRSNMTPMIVARNGKAMATLGSPGGGRIPGTLINILIHKIDFGLHLDDAIEAPRIYVDIKGKRILYESRIPEEALLEALRILGDPLVAFELEKKPAYDRYFGGAQGIWLADDDKSGPRYQGGADSRRDGVARSP